MYIILTILLQYIDDLDNYIVESLKENHIPKEQS